MAKKASVLRRRKSRTKMFDSSSTNAPGSGDNNGVDRRDSNDDNVFDVEENRAGKNE